MVNKRLQSSILEVVDNQLRDNTPPQTRITFDSLKKLGYSDLDAKKAIAQALVKEMYEVMTTGREYDEAGYIRDLKQIAKGELLFDGADEDYEPDIDDDSFYMDDYDEWDEDDDLYEGMELEDQRSEYLWQDLLRDKLTVELREMANMHNIRTRNKSRKQIAVLLADYCLRPDVMRESFIHMSDELAEKMDRLMETGSSDPEENIPELLEDSGLDPVYFHSGYEVPLMVADDVMAAYREMNTPEFQALRREWNWTYECLKAFLLLYGAGPASAFADLYNTHPQLSLKETDVFDQLKKLGKDGSELYVRLNDIICRRDLQKKKKWKKLVERQKDTPFALPSFEQIKDLGVFGYPFHDQAYARMREFLNGLEEPAVFAEQYLCFLFTVFSTQKGYNEIFTGLSDMYIEMTDEETEQFKELVNKLGPHTPLIEKRGNTDADIVIDDKVLEQGAESYMRRVRTAEKPDDWFPGCDDLPF